ncbi:MAG: glycosyltransferase family 2 protein [Solirubrobacterales bacterium]
MRFSLIIVTKDRPVSLAAALESSAKALPADGEVIVVDGDPERSAEPVVRGLQARNPDMSVRHVASEPGAARQRNVGIDAADGDVVVYVDDDCTFEPGLFEALAAAYSDPAVVGATGRIEQPLRGRLGNNPHSRLRWLLLGGGRQGSMTSFGFRCPIIDLEQPRDVEFMPGPLMSARRDVAAEVRFDQRLAAYSLVEDDDFSYRVSRRGRIRYEPAAVVHHHELRWGERDQRQMDRLQVVNRTYLFRKNFAQTFTARARFVALLALFCAHRVLNREWSGLLGLLEGMRHVRRTGGQPLEEPLKEPLQEPLEAPAIAELAARAG